MPSPILCALHPSCVFYFPLNKFALLNHYLPCNLRAYLMRLLRYCSMLLLRALSYESRQPFALGYLTCAFRTVLRVKYHSPLFYVPMSAFLRAFSLLVPCSFLLCLRMSNASISTHLVPSCIPFVFLSSLLVVPSVSKTFLAIQSLSGTVMT